MRKIGKKPNKCDQCSSSFLQNGGLTRHKRIHTGFSFYFYAENLSGFLYLMNISECLFVYIYNICVKIYGFRGRERVQRLALLDLDHFVLDVNFCCYSMYLLMCILQYKINDD